MGRSSTTNIYSVKADCKFSSVQIYIYIYVCVCIYNLHLIVRPTSESKNEMGPHVVTHCQVAATGMGCSVHGGAEGTQTQST